LTLVDRSAPQVSGQYDVALSFAGEKYDLLWLNDGNHNIDVAKYVIESDEFVNRIVASATNELKRTTDNRYLGFAAALEEGNNTTLLGMAEALYLHVKNDYHLRYEYERGFNEATGEQFVRTPQMVGHENRGTCVDLVLLFLGCLANVRLWPVYIQIRIKSPWGDVEVDHALAATWLEEPCYNRDVFINPARIHQYVSERRLLLLDCTGFVEGFPRRQYKLSFAESQEEAQELLKTNQFRFALDVRRAWETGVSVVSPTA
jgi:hypothetical protein